MKYFRISVNGKTFDVDVEEFSSAENRANALPVASAKGNLIGPVLSKHQHYAMKEMVPQQAEANLKSAPAAEAEQVVSTPVLPVQPTGAAAEDSKAVTVPMPGKIVSVQVEAGQFVEAGQELMVMEAMKMLNPILAPSDGQVKEVFVKSGDAVQTGTVVMIFE